MAINLSGSLNSPVFDMTREFMNIGLSDSPSESRPLKARNKPKLIVPRCYLDLARARGAWRSSLVNCKPDAVAAKEFLYYKLREHEEINIEKWESYGIVIAKQREKVNPFCMYTVSTEDSEPETSGADASDKYDVTLMLYALGLYHLHADYNYYRRRSVCNELQGYLAPFPGAPTLLQLVKASVDNEDTTAPTKYNENFGKLVAGIDMFLVRFPASPLSALRVGTMWTRYKDCEALSGVIFFMKMIGIKEIEKVKFWLIQNPLLIEFSRIMTPNEEPGNENSFMPYMAEMGLVSTSVPNLYSAAANSCLHYFVHAVGALMGIEGSINEKMQKDVGSTVDFNVKLVAFAFNKFQKEIKLRVQTEGHGGPPVNPEMIKSFEHVRTMVQAQKYIPGAAEVIHKLKNEIVNPQRGTVGYYLKHIM